MQEFARSNDRIIDGEFLSISKFIELIPKVEASYLDRKMPKGLAILVACLVSEDSRHPTVHSISSRLHMQQL